MTNVEKFEFIKAQLYVAAVSDILDALGRPGQVMHHRLRPLLPDIHHCGFVGRARTAQWVESPFVDVADPYGLEIDLMDSELTYAWVIGIAAGLLGGVAKSAAEYPNIPPGADFEGYG